MKQCTYCHTVSFDTRSTCKICGNAEWREIDLDAATAPGPAQHIGAARPVKWSHPEEWPDDDEFEKEAEA